MRAASTTRARTPRATAATEARSRYSPPVTSWTWERKVEAAARASQSGVLLRDDTEVIERPGWYQIVTPSARGFLNEIQSSVVEPGDVDRLVDEAIATYHPLGTPVKWYVGPRSRPTDLGERLARRGFRASELSGMGRDTAPIEAPEGVSARAVTDEAGLRVFSDVSMRGWSMAPEQVPAHERALAKALSATPRLALFYVAYLEGEPAGTAALVLRGDYGYLMGGVVIEAARGRGVYRALVAERLAFLRAEGLEYAVTHAYADTSAPILERLGFETLFRSRCYALDP